MKNNSSKKHYGNLKTFDFNQLEPYFTTKEIKIPENDFVVSKDKSNEPLSLYGDNIWDFTAYRQAGDIGPAKIIFDFGKQHTLDEAKWLLFLLIFVAESKSNYGLSIATIMTIKKSIKQLSKYAELRSKSIKSILNSREEIDGFVKKQKRRSLLESLSSLIGYLASIDPNVSGYDLVNYYNKNDIRSIIQKFPQPKQFPVIPPRILSELIEQLEGYLKLVHSKINKLINFIEKIVNDDLFARSEYCQRKRGVSDKQYKPGFSEAARSFGLSDLFNRYEVTNLNTFGGFLTRTQSACRTWIHIYTGMRSAEVYSLKIDSLFTKKNARTKSYHFKGETSKLAGQKKEITWTTSKDVIIAFEIANKLAKIIAVYSNTNIIACPLFISHSYLNLHKTIQDKKTHLFKSNSSVRSQEIYRYFDQEKFVITEIDFTHLYKVDPFRSWQDEEAFKIGNTWRFTTHQFRRSLAFYASQSANVSLTALKNQLKHITREMTIFYCNASVLADNFDHDGHFSHLFQTIKTESDTIAYIDLLENNDAPLFGAHGKFIDKNLKPKYLNGLLPISRKEITNQFKNGELQYAETPLGACMSTEPCDKKLFRVISACLNCKMAMIKPQKLKAVISLQDKLVRELKSKSIDSIAYRTELSELENLINFSKLNGLAYE